MIQRTIPDWPGVEEVVYLRCAREGGGAVIYEEYYSITRLGGD